VDSTALRSLNRDLDALLKRVDNLIVRSTPRAPALRSAARPRVLVLGASFAGLEAAQKICRYARGRVDVTVVDRKAYLLFVPNLLTEILADRNPGDTLHMPVEGALQRDGVHFVLGTVREVDLGLGRVRVDLVERPGAGEQWLPYDYLVIALGCRLAYDAIPGFSAFGHTLTDTYHANRLRTFLHRRYRGGPIVMGSARFHQGSRLDGWIPAADAACEGPVMEVLFSLGSWLTRRGVRARDLITFFTPGDTFAVEAGPRAAAKILDLAAQKGYRYLNRVGDIDAVTADGVRFTDGREAAAELAILLPDWVPHPFLAGLDVADPRGFVVTDRHMRCPGRPNVLAVGDAAAATVPKLGYLAHLQSEVVAWQIASDVGVDPPRGTAPVYQPLVDCFAVMGPLQAAFVRTNVWYGGHLDVMKGGPVPYILKALYKQIFFMTKGKVPNWSVTAANYVAEHLSKRLI
jgi:sulfide:quinone oxidoreductase